MKPEPDELTEALLAARDGDRLALAAAIRSAQADVWRFVAHLVGTNDADDVTQDVFVRAWRALPRYRGDASGRTWLLAIARRACVDTLRRRGRSRKLIERLSHGAALRVVEPDPAPASALSDLVERLSPNRRIAFVLTQLLGCSYAEVSEICGVPIGTVRSRVSRARADLIDQIGDDAAMETG